MDSTPQRASLSYVRGARSLVREILSLLWLKRDFTICTWSTFRFATIEHPGEGKGTIRDISDRGVFIITDTVPPVGAHLDVDVHLPSLDVSSGAVQLHGEGVVVRVETGADEGRGFAARVVFQTEIAGGRSVIDPRKVQ